MSGIEPKGEGYQPGLAEAFGGPGDNYMGDDFAGWGRFDHVTAGDQKFKTICECRLDSRWAGRHGHGMPQNPTALQLLQGFQRMQGTDAPFSNSIFLRNDSPNIPVTALIEFGSGHGNDQFYCSVGTGTNLYVPCTYWRVSMRIDQIAMGAAPPFPVNGVKANVGAMIGRGTGAHNTRPHLDQYVGVADGLPKRIRVPKRADSFILHLGPTTDAASSVTENGLGGSTLAEWRGPLVQDKEYPIFPGADVVIFSPNLVPTSLVVRFLLV